MNTLLILMAATALAAPAWAANKCKGPDGKVFYQDLPCECQEKVILSGTGSADPGATGPSYYKREADRMAREEKLDAQREAFEAKTHRAILNKEVFVSMLAEDARKSWGAPTRINSSVWAGGRSEQCVYDRGSSRSQYIYVRDGIVSSTQSSQ
jgi:hypothetical protein